MSAYILDVAVEPGPSKRHCGSHVAHRVGCRVHAFRTLSLYRTKSRSRLRTKRAGDAYPRTHLLFTVQKTRVCYLVFSMAASSMRAFASTHAVGSRVASGGLTGRARTHGASPKLVVVHKPTRRGRGNFSTVRASVKADDVPEPVAMEAAAVTSAPPAAATAVAPSTPNDVSVATANIAPLGSNLSALQAQLAALSATNAALVSDLEAMAKKPEVAKTKEQEKEANRLAAIADPLAHAGLAKPIGYVDVIEPRVLAPGELLIQNMADDIKWPSPDEQPPFWERAPYPSPLKNNADDELTNAKKTDQPLHVVHVTAEMAPIAKVGGLGDVVTGLARAHLLNGHNVEVILPYYSSIEGKVDQLQHVMDFDVTKGKETEWDGVREIKLDNFSTSMYTGVIGGCNVILLKPAAKERSNIFVGGKIYGGSYNELESYLYFCRAALECLKVTNRDPNVIHVHEWQCSGTYCAFPKSRLPCLPILD